jgi:hypothetical protein
MSQTALVPISPSVASTRRHLAAQPALPFSDHLPQQQIDESLAEVGGVFRDRIYTPPVTLWTFLSQLLDPDHSCRAAVARLLAFRTVLGLPPCSADNGAYCKARKRIPEELLHQLTCDTGQQLMNQADTAWLWKGRHVKIVDGTGVSMPDTPANQKAYPQPKKIKPGIGFPLLRLVVVFSLAVGTVLEAAMAPFEGKRTGEVTLFRTIDEVVQPGDVLLADRLYANYWDVVRSKERGVDVVMRMHAGRTAVWFRGRGHKKGNRRVWWHKPQRPSWMSQAEYDEIPDQIRLRAVRVDVRQRGFRTRRLVLVTTLTDAEAYPAEDLAALYRRRWEAELDLRSIKTVLQMDVVRGKTPEMVRKEVWGHMLIYNIIRKIMAEAAKQRGVRPEEVSFTGAVQTVNAFLPHLQGARTAEERERLWAVLLEAVGRHRVGHRPDRYEPREVKRRPKNFRRMTEPRAEGRRRLRKGVKEKGKKR